jgi:hypothetical protein
MGIPSGHGGYLFPSPEGDVPIVAPVGQWEGDWVTRLGEVTQSDGGGATRYKPVVEDNSWSAEWAFDDEAFEDALGLENGTELAQMFFRKGNSLLCDRLDNTTVERCSPVCDNKGDVVRIRANGKGGKLTRNVALPVDLDQL